MSFKTSRYARNGNTSNPDNGRYNQFLSLTNSMSNKTPVLQLQSEYITAQVLTSQGAFKSHAKYILLATIYACQISSQVTTNISSPILCFILFNIQIQAAIRKSHNPYLYMHGAYGGNNTCNQAQDSKTSLLIVRLVISTTYSLCHGKRHFTL